MMCQYRKSSSDINQNELSLSVHNRRLREGMHYALFL